MLYVGATIVPCLLWSVVRDLLDALIVSDKYDMTHVNSKVQAALREALKKAWMGDTLRIFAIAYQLCLEELLEAAAYRSLTFSFKNWPHVDKFALIPATAITQLSKYRRKCSHMLAGAMLFVETAPLARCSWYEDDDDDGEDDDTQYYGKPPLELGIFCRLLAACGHCAELLVSSDGRVRGWFKEYLMNLRHHFGNSPYSRSPQRAQGAFFAQSAEIMMANCPICRRTIHHFAAMEKSLLRWLDKLVLEVSPFLSNRMSCLPTFAFQKVRFERGA